jgi:hypothetical protein
VYTNQQIRNYRCKDDELPVICGYAAYTLERDLADFQAYSPRFSEEYRTLFLQQIETAAELVNPKDDTARLKAVTARLYATADGLLPLISRIEGYVKLAGAAIPVTPSDFAFSQLRKKVSSRDMEGALHNLRLMTRIVQKYAAALMEVGLSCDLIAALEDIAHAIVADNGLQYEILTKRMELVKDNVHVLNSLYARLMEICEVGKILYGKTSPEKANEYTFNYLLKKVRHVTARPAAKD